jgi:hypothetical protein
MRSSNHITVTAGLTAALVGVAIAAAGAAVIGDVAIGASLESQPAPIEMHVDSPFLLTIRYSETGADVFQGLGPDRISVSPRAGPNTNDPSQAARPQPSIGR